MAAEIIKLNTGFQAAHLEYKVASRHQDAVRMLQDNIKKIEHQLQNLAHFQRILHEQRCTAQDMLDSNVEILNLITGAKNGGNY